MITDIRLQHFRSYADDAFELSGGVNIIVGPNASGKTNLLEALLVVARGVSYRANNSELIQFEQPWARVDAHTIDGQRTIKLTAGEPRAQKSFEINGQKYYRLSLDKTLPLVLFEPQHLQLLTGRPELRRDYLDDILDQTISSFGKLRRDYKRVLAQRNHLLKQGRKTGERQLFPWNIRLSELGGQVAGYRTQLVKSIRESLPSIYQKISNSSAQIDASYVSGCQLDNYSDQLLHKLEDSEYRDFAQGFTSFGPHRDDLQVQLNNHLAQASASRGETRTLILALKMIELEQIENQRKQKPLLLLDDVFSELDGTRRKTLTRYLKNYQTFITTTDADLVVHNFSQGCAILPIGKQKT